MTVYAPPILIRRFMVGIIIIEVVFHGRPIIAPQITYLCCMLDCAQSIDQDLPESFAKFTPHKGSILSVKEIAQYIKNRFTNRY